MATAKDTLLGGALLGTMLIRVLFSAWFLIAAAAWVAFARSDRVKLQNYETCDAKSAFAFAHDNLEDMLHSASTEVQNVLYRLEEDARRTCMEGKGYSVSNDGQCFPAVLESTGFVTSAPLECYHRNIYQAVAAQIR